MAAAFTEEEKIRIRADLLRAGERCFTGMGLKKTSVDELTTACGISKGSFYLFFKSKEELFIEILEEKEKFREELLEKVLLKEKGARKQLRSFLLDTVRFTASDPFFKHVFSSDDAVQAFRRLPPEKIRKNIEADLIFSEKLISSLRLSGGKILYNPAVLTGMLRAFMLGLLHKNEIGEEVWEEAAKASAEVFALGLLCSGERK